MTRNFQPYIKDIIIGSIVLIGLLSVHSSKYLQTSPIAIAEEPFKIGGNGYQCLGDEATRWKTNNSNMATLPIGMNFASIVVKTGRIGDDKDDKCVAVYPTNTASGCYSVNISGQNVTVTKIGDGSECKDISHLEGTYSTSPTPITCDNNHYPDNGECKEKTSVCNAEGATNKGGSDGIFDPNKEKEDNSLCEYPPKNCETNQYKDETGQCVNKAVVCGDETANNYDNNVDEEKEIVDSTNAVCTYNKVNVCRDEAANNYDSDFNDRKEIADNSVCTYASSAPSPTPTPSPEPTPNTTKSSDNNSSSNNSSNNSGSTQGEVLGLATTGVAEDVIMNALGSLGGLMTVAGSVLYGKKKRS